MKRRRELSGTEKALWSRVADTVTPLHEFQKDWAAHTVLSTITKTEHAHRNLNESPPRVKDASTLKTPSNSPIGAGNPAKDRKASRGRIKIGATLDLHGLNQTAAHAAVIQFVHDGARRRHRLLLIITGKGGKQSGSGILKRRFQHWVEEPSIRPHISRVSRAHQRHGGDGAFYVFLKTSTT